MNDPEAFIDQRLAELGRATEGIAPAPGFDDFIVRAVERRSGVVWFETMWRRTGRAALLIGALAAAASVVLAVSARTELDEQTLTTFEMVELSE